MRKSDVLILYMTWERSHISLMMAKTHIYSIAAHGLQEGCTMVRSLELESDGDIYFS